MQEEVRVSSCCSSIWTGGLTRIAADGEIGPRLAEGLRRARFVRPLPPKRGSVEDEGDFDDVPV